MYKRQVFLLSFNKHHYNTYHPLSLSTINIFSVNNDNRKTCLLYTSSFFEIGTDKSLFDGLYISQNKSLCDEHMGKYAVIFISLKDVEGLSYDEAFQVLSLIHI